MSILVSHNLSVGYKGYAVASHLNLSLERGTLTALIGVNGCGKSTLIRTLSGLQKPIDGTIQINGDNLNSISGSQRAKLISHVLTDNDYIRSIKVKDMVAMGRLPYTDFMGNLSAKDLEIVEQAMQKVDIQHKSNRFFYELSDGERQRTLIAKALAQDTPIMFLDEPTSFLDMRNKIEIMVLLHTIAHNEDKTILLSTHDVEIALQTADNIWLMDGGNITAGTPESLITDGKIADTFRSEAFTFDSESCSFRINNLETF